MDNYERALTVRFGRFLLDSRRRELRMDGVLVPTGGRAFDILAMLVAADGQLVTKDELMSRVWPGRFVEENNLQFQISTLRKALGADRDFIKTVAGRGYRFIADISTPADPDTAAFARRAVSPPSTDFPAAMADLIGHYAKLIGPADLTTAYRLAALRGAGGIGETRPGSESGRPVLSELADAARFAASGPSGHPEFVFPGIAALLQLARDGSATSATLAPRLVLLLLPECGLSPPPHPGGVWSVRSSDEGTGVWAGAAS
jgi:non-specific serine/threonine protein kinase